MSDFKWTEKSNMVAVALANGKTRAEAAEEAGINERTVYRWLDIPEFNQEVDRLSLMTDIASRAERLRLAKRVIRQMVADGKIKTDKDLLDWLKFAQSETDGAKVDAASILAALTDNA